MNPVWRQSSDSVRLDWGISGGFAIAADVQIAVVRDVLSFATAVSVAIDRGATVYPYRWAHQAESARAFAFDHDAQLASPRSMSEPQNVSLSPGSIRDARELDRIVLRSPNGSTISEELGHQGAIVLTACFRNRRTVANWLWARRSRNDTFTVARIAAGERWPDVSLRPAVEDLWVAGALVAELVTKDWSGVAPEAMAASARFAAVANALLPALESCASGLELVAAGWHRDVAIAAELDASESVALVVDGRFINAETPHGHFVQRPGIH